MSDAGDYATGIGGGAASGAAIGSAGGPWGAAIGGVIGGGLGAFNVWNSHKGASSYKANLDAAIAQSKTNQAQLMQMFDAKKAAALGFYSPMQKLFNQSYGTAGINAPVVPQAGNAPLSTMYGGGK